MYSMVLVMALSTGASTPASCFGYNGCYGGNGCAGYGCNGYRNGCHGLFGGGFFGRHGCNGYGCNGYGCNGCNGGYRHGLFGGWFGRHGCNGYGCNGGCYGYRNGCAGCNGGHHPTALPPADKPATPRPPAPGGAPKVEGKEEATIPTPARLLVTLPADAKLSIDDVLTQSTSATRLFVTPELAPGKDYVYTLKAEITRNGNTETVTKQVTVRAGKTTEAMIEMPVATAAK